MVIYYVYVNKKGVSVIATIEVLGLDNTLLDFGKYKNEIVKILGGFFSGLKTGAGYLEYYYQDYILVNIQYVPDENMVVAEQYEMEDADIEATEIRPVDLTLKF